MSSILIDSNATPDQIQAAAQSIGIKLEGGVKASASKEGTVLTVEAVPGSPLKMEVSASAVKPGETLVVKGGATADAVTLPAGIAVNIDMGAGGDVVDLAKGVTGTLNLGAGSDSVAIKAGTKGLTIGLGNDTDSDKVSLDKAQKGRNQDFDDLIDAGRSLGRKAKVNKIEGFHHKEDIIDLDRALLPGSKLKPGKLSKKDFISVNKLTPDVKAKIVYEKKTGILYYNPMKGQDVALVQLEKNLPITSVDIQIS